MMVTSRDKFLLQTQLTKYNLFRSALATPAVPAGKVTHIPMIIRGSSRVKLGVAGTKRVYPSSFSDYPDGYGLFLNLGSMRYESNMVGPNSFSTLPDPLRYTLYISMIINREVGWIGFEYNEERHIVLRDLDFLTDEDQELYCMRSHGC